MSPDQFRADFVEFADTTTFPDTQIALWLNVATTSVNPDRWGTLFDLGVELVAAHYLVVAARGARAADTGGLPGQVAGLATSKSVGDVSGSFDFSQVVSEGAGFWNQTSYGIRFWQLARRMGAGGLQLPSSVVAG